jgi:hypothetical protein
VCVCVHTHTLKTHTHTCTLSRSLPPSLPRSLSPSLSSADGHKAALGMGVSIALEFFFENVFFSKKAMAALGLGVTMALQVRARRQALPAGAAQAQALARALGSPWQSAEFARLNDRVREATAWLQAAFNAGHGYAQLHLANIRCAVCVHTYSTYSQTHATRKGMHNCTWRTSGMPDE